MMENHTDQNVQFTPSYFNMPLFLLNNKNISKLAVAVYQTISMLSSKDRGCWASNGYFSAMFDAHPSTISGIISTLRKEGLIKVAQNGPVRYIKIIEEFNDGDSDKKIKGINLTMRDEMRNRIEEFKKSRSSKLNVEKFEELLKNQDAEKSSVVSNNGKSYADRLRLDATEDVDNRSDQTNQYISSILEVEEREIVVSSSKEEEWTREASQASSSQESKWRKVNNISTQTNNTHLDKSNIQRLPDNNSTVTLKKESKALRKCSSYKNDSAPVEIVDKWESLGFPKVDAKYRLSTLSKIEDLMRGDFFEDKLLENGNSKYSHRPFTKDEILSAIENRARGAFDFNYAPTTKKSKQSMSKLPMSVWIYNSNGGVSYFLKDFEKPYKKIPEKLRLIDDEYPDYTESIIEKYTEEILYNVAPKEWSIKDLNSFRKSAQRLREYFVDIEDRSRHIRLHEIERQIDVLIRALREHYGQDEEDEGAKIHPTNLCSDFTFNRILPNYMGRQRMLSGKNLIG